MIAIVNRLLKANFTIFLLVQFSYELSLVFRFLICLVLSRALYFVPTGSRILFCNLLFRKRQRHLKAMESYSSYVENYQSSIQRYLEALDPNEWLVGREILDLGSGLGQYSRLLKMGGAAAVVGLEYQADKIEWAAANLAAPGISFTQGSAYDLPFNIEKFDSIFSHTVFEHFQEPKRALEECWRVLKPGGHLLLIYHFIQQKTGHHLTPYIRIPWATFLFRDEDLCLAFSELVRRHQKGRKQHFYPANFEVKNFGAGSELSLNKLGPRDFERIALEVGFVIQKALPQEIWTRIFPSIRDWRVLGPYLSGSVLYVMKKAI